MCTWLEYYNPISKFHSLFNAALTLHKAFFYIPYPYFTLLVDILRLLNLHSFKALYRKYGLFVCACLDKIARDETEQCCLTPIQKEYTEIELTQTKSEKNSQCDVLALEDLNSVVDFSCHPLY